MVSPATVLPFEALANPDDWVNSKGRPDCSMCMTKFTTFKRRHHCRVCGDVICSTCFVKLKANIPMVGVIDIKVCSSCANDDNRIKNRRPSNAKSSSSSFSSSSSSSASIANSDEFRFVQSRSMSSYIEDRASSSAKVPSHPSESMSTYSSSVFSSSSSFGVSPGETDDFPVDGTFVFADELDDQNSNDNDDDGAEARSARKNYKDVRAEWLQHAELQPLRQLSEPNDRYDIWVMRHVDGLLLQSKQLSMAHINGESIEQFIDVVELVSQLQHPHIIDFVGVAWSAGKRLQALYEYLPRGDLRSFLDATARDAKSRQERSRLKLQMALDLAEALVHLHSFSPPLVHGALDSGEVTLTKGYRAKLGGIGATSLDRAAKKSRRWQAPEVVQDASVYLPASDVYAFGVILCELDTHQAPYSDCLTPQGEPLPEDEIVQMVASGDLQPTISRDCPSELRSLASDCLAFDPEKRPSAVEITVRLRMFIRSYGLEKQESGGDSKRELYDMGF